VTGVLRPDRRVDLTVPSNSARGSAFARYKVDEPSQDVLESIAAFYVPGNGDVDSRVVKYAPRYKLIFSLMIQDATQKGSAIAWEVDKALRGVYEMEHRTFVTAVPTDLLGRTIEHIQPLLYALGPLHNFTVETQVQFFSPLTFEPTASDQGWIINQGQLKTFVNSAEWSLCRWQRPMAMSKAHLTPLSLHTQHHLSPWIRSCISFSTYQHPTEALFISKDFRASALVSDQGQQSQSQQRGRG
jgi:Phosphatidylinositol-glycan biosynthesis class S protein